MSASIDERPVPSWLTSVRYSQITNERSINYIKKIVKLDTVNNILISRKIE